MHLPNSTGTCITYIRVLCIGRHCHGGIKLLYSVHVLRYVPSRVYNMVIEPLPVQRVVVNCFVLGKSTVDTVIVVYYRTTWVAVQLHIVL